jgi:hypothetical protein
MSVNALSFVLVIRRRHATNLTTHSFTGGYKSTYIRLYSYVGMCRYTLLEMKENIRWSLASQQKRDKKDKDRMRGVFFCLGYSTFWDRPMHKELKKLRDKRGLTWMRISMSSHRFPNLRDIFQSALTAKMIENFFHWTFNLNHANARLQKTNVSMGRCAGNQW